MKKMIEETKTVFDKLNEILAIMAEELHGANDALYVVATEMIDLNERLDALNAKLDKITSQPVKVKLENTPQPKQKAPVFPKIEMPEFAGEWK